MMELDFDSGHSDIVQDIKQDPYSTVFATCSSDCTVRIFDLDQNHDIRLIQVLSGHGGPVWRIEWTCTPLGCFLASCSYDGRVMVWKMNAEKNFDLFKNIFINDCSVNSISWAPEEVGLVLACGSSDGYIYIIYLDEFDYREIQRFQAHKDGCLCVAWSVLDEDSEDDRCNFSNMVLSSGGCDNMIRFWKYNENSQGWESFGDILRGHEDWIRDMAWAPSIFGFFKILASCSQDKQVLVWYIDYKQQKYVMKKLTEEKFPDIVWRVSWSFSSQLLAVSCGSDHFSVWMETLDKKWKIVGKSILGSSFFKDVKNPNSIDFNKEKTSKQDVMSDTIHILREGMSLHNTRSGEIALRDISSKNLYEDILLGNQQPQTDAVNQSDNCLSEGLCNSNESKPSHADKEESHADQIHTNTHYTFV